VEREGGHHVHLDGRRDGGIAGVEHAASVRDGVESCVRRNCNAFNDASSRFARANWVEVSLMDIDGKFQTKDKE
jgi:hypothetical protein